jgi:glutamyl-tRNA reductase
MNKQLEIKIQPEIPLLVVGYDFKTSSSALRDKLITSQEDRHYLLDAIRKMDPSAGLLVLETCNRVEWIVSTQMPKWVAEILKTQMLRFLQKSGVNGSDPVPHPKLYRRGEALIHVIRVVSGLESLAVGEAQIAGQFQEAVQRSQREKTSNIIINRLAHIAGRMAKYGYEIGIRSNCKTGIHGLVAHYIDSYFGPETKNRSVLVVGMGEIGRKTASLIEENLKCRVMRFNRTVKPRHQREWISLDKLGEFIPSADVVVAATGASSPVITENELSQERQDTLLIMDIGIPRQVSESAQSVSFVEYRNIDHLQSCLAHSESPEVTANFQDKIAKEIGLFRQYCRSRDLTTFLSTIHSMRQDFVYNKIPAIFAAEMSGLNVKSRNKIETAMKQMVNEYSANMFRAFHQAMESFWSRNGNE